MRAGVCRVLVVGAVCGALYAPAAGARTDVLARWQVTVSGSVRHSWSLPDSEPCQASGDGFVSARFASVHPKRITIADNGFGPGDITWNGVFDNIKARSRPSTGGRVTRRRTARIAITRRPSRTPVPAARGISTQGWRC
jgi:hypothetical protein